LKNCWAQATTFVEVISVCSLSMFGAVAWVACPGRIDSGFFTCTFDVAVYVGCVFCR
jgi:hypothetical protein